MTKSFFSNDTEDKKNENIPQQTIHKFLEHVAFGEQDKANEMLKEIPSLAYAKGDVTDYSGRQFKNISGFQYALWAMDVHMWRMMLPEEEKNIPEDAKKQLIEVEEMGVTYFQPGLITEEKAKSEDEEERKKIKELLESDTKDDPFLGNRNLMGLMLSYHSADTRTESHYDFKLIEALKIFGDNLKTIDDLRENECSNYTDEDWSKLSSILINVVGGAQRLVPAHIANHYCTNSYPFNPTPTFGAKENLRRVLHANGTFFPLDKNPKERLGFNFAFMKGRRQAYPVGNMKDDFYMESGESVESLFFANEPFELTAMKSLRDARQKDLEELRKQLGISPKKGIQSP